MKIFIRITLFLVVSMAFVGCEKDDDPRDIFVGNYTGTMTMTMIMTSGTESETETLTNSGSFSIERGSADNTVVMLTAGERQVYTVSGNTISASYPMTTTENGVTINMQVSENGTLMGSSLVVTAVGSGSGIYEGVVVGLQINSVLNATKK